MLKLWHIARPIARSKYFKIQEGNKLTLSYDIFVVTGKLPNDTSQFFSCTDCHWFTQLKQVASMNHGARDMVVVVVVVYSQFLYRYKQTQSAKTRFRQAGARQRVVNGYHNK